MRSLRTVLPFLLAITTTCKEGTGPTTDELVQMVLDFCDLDAPEFVAVRSSAGGAWVRVTGNASDTYTLNVPESFGLAVVYEGGDFFEAEVLYVSREDLAFLDGRACEDGPPLDRTITGSAPGLSGFQQAEVSILDGFAFMDASQNTFAIGLLPSQPLDLVAIRFNGSSLDRIIVRRNLSGTATTTTPLDFAGSEGITPATNTLTFSGGGNDFIGVDRLFHSSLGTVALLLATETGSTSATFVSVPTAQTIDGDMHQMIVSAFHPTEEAVRSVRTFFRAAGDLTSALGPHLPMPSVTFNGTPQRPRVQVTSQLDYQGTAFAFIEQGLKSIAVTKTTGYDGATPAVWDMEFPDLNGVAGFPGGGLTNGAATDWIVTATNAPVSFILGEAGNEGQIVKSATRASFSAATYGNRPASRLLRSHRPGGRRVR